MFNAAKIMKIVVQTEVKEQGNGYILAENP